MLSVWVSLCFALSLAPGTPINDLAVAASRVFAIQEFDAEIQDWRKGQVLQLRHPLFDLTRVFAGPGAGGPILFSGTGHGAPGEVSLVFYTLEGEQVYSPPGTVSVARVDEKRREFHVAGAIPSLLRGRAGVVQVTFTGDRRASYLLKVHF